MTNKLSAPDTGAHQKVAKTDYASALSQYYKEVNTDLWYVLDDWEQEPDHTMVHKWSLDYLCTDPEFVKFTHHFMMAHPWKGHMAVPKMKTILEKAPLGIIKDDLKMRLIGMKHVAYILDEDGKKVATVDKLTIDY